MESRKQLKIWCDDERPAPDGWMWVKTAGSAIAALHFYDVEALSLDHDLGDTEALTGYDVALHCAEHEIWPKEIYVHSANGVGRQNILQIIGRYHPLGEDARRLAARVPAPPVGENWDALWREAGAYGEDPK